MTEGDETFMRITATGDDAYIYSSQYPRSVSSSTRYCVIKYRTSSAKAGDLGLIYKSTSLKEYDLSETAYDRIVGDGKWHYLYLDMGGETHWQDWIVSLGVVPFVGAEGVENECVDIAWIKFYHEDPWDIYEADWYPEPTEPESTTAPGTEDESPESTDAKTEAPDQTDAKTEEKTEADTQAASGGCGSVVAVPAIALIAMLGVAFVAKKKD